MEKILFSFPGNETIGHAVAMQTGMEQGEWVVRHFPDGESYVRVISPVAQKEVIIYCSLHHPDEKIIPLYFLCRAMRENGAVKIVLMAPYLPYLRQDKLFKPGETISSKHFANLISTMVDEVITIEPHLHRWHELSEIYVVPCRVLHVTELVGDYLLQHVSAPVLIGPDAESEQWVSNIARYVNAPFLILNKERMSDNRVKVNMPGISEFGEKTPVLLDDIISTAHTMMETMAGLRKSGFSDPVCIGVHAIFSGYSYDELKHAHAMEIVTCNTILHPSNKIDITPILVEALK